MLITRANPQTIKGSLTSLFFMDSNLLWQRKVLPSGLTVLLYPRASDMTTYLSTVINYGANSDSEENAGCAHFLEHMIAGGSKERIEWSRAIEHLGGIYNPSTNCEYTLNTVSVNPKKISAASSILRNLIFNPHFEVKNLALERKIILNEIADVSDDPRQKVNEMLRKCLFKTHPIKRPVSGSKKTVRNLSLDTLQQSHISNYVLPNIVLIMTGNFSDEDVESVISDFETFQGRKTYSKRQSFSEYGKPRKELKLIWQGINQTYLSMGVRTVPSKNDDAHILDFINTILGSGTSSRLFVRVREKLGLAYDISASHEIGLDYGYFAIDCSLKPNKTEQVITAIKKELAKLRGEPIQEEELQKCKNMISDEYMRLRDSSADFTEIIAENEIQFNYEYALIEYVKKINAVTPRNIIACANRYLQEDNLSTALLSPK